MTETPPADLRTVIEPGLLRRLSARRVLDALRDHGAQSRASLARRTGLSAPTISKVVQSLLESGLVEPGDAVVGGRGRPGHPVRLATSRRLVVGVVLDPHHVVCVAAGLDGLLRPERVTRATPTEYAALVQAVAEAVRRQVAGVDVAEGEAPVLAAVGLSTPGLIDRERQRILLSPNLPQTNERALADDLAAELGVPCVMVQESHGLCLAEQRRTARGLDDFAMLDATAGLGLGVLERGTLLHGRRGLAGELGHVTMQLDGHRCGCGNRGCLETLATDTALRRRWRELGGHDRADFADAGGDPAFQQALDETLSYLAVAVAAVINLFNPAAVYVNAALLDARAGLLDELRARVAARALGPSLAGCHVARARGSKHEGAVAGAFHHLADAAGPSLR